MSSSCYPCKLGLGGCSHDVRCCIVDGVRLSLQACIRRRSAGGCSRGYRLDGKVSTGVSGRLSSPPVASGERPPANGSGDWPGSSGRALSAPGPGGCAGLPPREPVRRLDSSRGDGGRRRHSVADPKDRRHCPKGLAPSPFSSWPSLQQVGQPVASPTTIARRETGFFRPTCPRLSVRLRARVVGLAALPPGPLQSPQTGRGKGPDTWTKKEQKPRCLRGRVDRRGRGATPQV